MAYEYVYYENKVMKSGFSSSNFVENETEAMKQMKKIADIICKQFNFATVIFEGYYEKTQIGNNSIRFVSARGNRMIIQLNEQDNLKCDAIKFKNKSGSIVNVVVKEKNEQNVDVFILHPTGGGQGSVELQYYFDEIGLATTWYNSYQYNGVSYLKDTFNFALLEEKGDETFGTPNSYKEKNDEGAYINSNINYIYTPLYYINHKQMTAIQQQYPKTLNSPENNGFIWGGNFKIKNTTFNNEQSTNQVWNFNFAEEELWLWDDFDKNYNDTTYFQIGYNKDTKTLKIRSAGGQPVQAINNIDMDDYQVYLLQRKIDFNLDKGINSDNREVIASENLTGSRLFNDMDEAEILITGNCILNCYPVDFTEMVAYVFNGSELKGYVSSTSSPQKMTLNWYETESSSFKSLYHQDALKYSPQGIFIQAQKYNNLSSNGHIMSPHAVMTAINWTWTEYKEGPHYEWDVNNNPTISLNFSVSINNFISHIPPTLDAPLVLQDNYCLSPEDLPTVRLSNIQIFITTPKSLQLPAYFSLLIGKETFTNVWDIKSNNVPIAAETLNKAGKAYYLWNDYRTYYGFLSSSCYSNITFAATSLQTKEDLQDYFYSSKSTARYGLILKKIK